MNNQETEKFQRFGGFFWLLLLGVGIGLPFVAALGMGLADMAKGNPFNIEFVLAMSVGFAFVVWIILLMLVAWGNFTSIFVKNTAKKVDSLPYHFNSGFTGRAGMLLIDVENGMIGFISAYNPLKIQIFNASRIAYPKTVASMMTGVRFVFDIDGKKVTMYTLLSNRMVNLKSGVGAEAVSKADAFVELLLAAKSVAESGGTR